ncbi:MAG: TetR/AcrR family transcriptional regulator [Polyangiaceae bacterium]|nr:TetR/AcrR family transcriptional regulator [Polyangiaceae bacterium]
MRERILAAAREHFGARGFEAVSVHALAADAGVTAAMINYYFGGKRALYEATVEEAQARLHAALAATLAEGAEPERLAVAYFDFLASERWMQRLLLREVVDGGAARGPALVRPLRALLVAHFGGDPEALDIAISLFGAIAAYFIYAPVLGELVGADPLSPRALARRRRHVADLVRRITRESP